RPIWLVVKLDKILYAHEAPSLHFNAANTTISVFKAHNVQWEDGKVTTILMNYMPSKRLKEAWDTSRVEGDYVGAVDREKAAITIYEALIRDPLWVNTDHLTWRIKSTTSFSSIFADRLHT
ncbi:hypothetical protein N7532_007367, partial [Penicillium argentinense]